MVPGTPGSSSGIGAATAVDFARQGATIAITGRNAENLERTRNQCLEAGASEGQVCVAMCEYMMTSSNGNIFRVTGPLCGEFIGHRWIPITKASDAELWCFPWSSPEQTSVNNGDAGYLRRHHAHYDVSVIRIYVVNYGLSLDRNKLGSATESYKYPFPNTYCK